MFRVFYASRACIMARRVKLGFFRFELQARRLLHRHRAAYISAHTHTHTVELWKKVNLLLLKTRGEKRDKGTGRRKKQRGREGDVAPPRYILVRRRDYWRVQPASTIYPPLYSSSRRRRRRRQFRNGVVVTWQYVTSF